MCDSDPLLENNACLKYIFKWNNLLLYIVVYNVNRKCLLLKKLIFIILPFHRYHKNPGVFFRSALFPSIANILLKIFK